MLSVRVQLLRLFDSSLYIVQSKATRVKHYWEQVILSNKYAVQYAIFILYHSQYDTLTVHLDQGGREVQFLQKQSIGLVILSTSTRKCIKGSNTAPEVAEN